MLRRIMNNKLEKNWPVIFKMRPVRDEAQCKSLSSTADDVVIVMVFLGG